MGLLGRPAEAAVWSQDSEGGAERPSDCRLPVEANRFVYIRDEESAANLVACLVHPARMQHKYMLYTTHEGKEKFSKIQTKMKIHKRNHKSSRFSKL